MNIDCSQGASEGEHMGRPKRDSHVSLPLCRPLHPCQRDQYEDRPHTQVKVTNRRTSVKKTKLTNQ